MVDKSKEFNKGAEIPDLGIRVSSYLQMLARMCKGCMRKGGNCATCPAEPAEELVRDIRVAGGVPDLHPVADAAPAAQIPDDPAELRRLAKELRLRNICKMREATAKLRMEKAAKIAAALDKTRLHLEDVSNRKNETLQALHFGGWVKDVDLPKFKTYSLRGSTIRSLLTAGLIEMRKTGQRRAEYRIAQPSPGEEAK